MASTATADILKALGTVKLFSACNKKELQSVARLCTLMTMAEGQVLTTEGTPGQECFVIAEGKANVTIGGQPVGTVGPGDCVGEMSLLDGGPRTATVTAASPISAYVMSSREFRSLLNLSPTITRKVATTLAQRLRALDAQYPH